MLYAGFPWKAFGNESVITTHCGIHVTWPRTSSFSLKLLSAGGRMAVKLGKVMEESCILPQL